LFSYVYHVIYIFLRDDEDVLFVVDHLPSITVILIFF
jgi:hypothetical protein